MEFVTGVKELMCFVMWVGWNWLTIHAVVGAGCIEIAVCSILSN
jgi:hypothetical protein